MKSRHNPVVSLKSLFVSSMILGSMHGYAQQQTAEKIGNPTVKTNNNTYDQKAYQKEMLDYRSMNQEFHNRPGSNNKTGILFITGAEKPGATENIFQVQKEIYSMLFGFSNNVTDVVGSPIHGVEMDSILTRLDKIGAQVTDEIILYVNIHGFSKKIIASSGNREEIGVFRHENEMWLNNREDGLVTADYFYGEIAKAFKTKPHLKNKKLIVSHDLCEGRSSSDASTLLNDKTEFMVYSGIKENSFNIGYSQSVELPFKDKPFLSANGDDFIMAAILTANRNAHAKKRNNPKIIIIGDKPSEPFHYYNESHRSVLYYPGNTAKIIDPLEDIWRLKKLRVDDLEIAQSFINHTKSLLNKEQQNEILANFKFIKTVDDLNNLEPHIRDGVFGVCYAYLKDHPKLQQPLLQSDLANNIKGYDPKTDYTNYSRSASFDPTGPK